MRAFVCRKEYLLALLGFAMLLVYGLLELNYELLFLPLYPLLAVFWLVRKLRERSDADRSTGSR